MATWEVQVSLRGDVQIVVEAETEDDACRRAEELAALDDLSGAMISFEAEGANEVPE